MIDENELHWLDPNDSESVYQVAQLHKELLTDSPIPQLGDLFMTEFYYKRLISADLINCLVYKHKSIVAGFIVITKYPGQFIRKGLSRYLPFVVYILSRAIIRKPNLIFTLIKVINLGFKRNNARIEGNVSELLSLGVKSNYRKLIDKSSKLRISHTLFCNAAKALIKDGYKTFQIITDKNNDRAISFYKSFDVKAEKSNINNDKKQILFKLNLQNFDTNTLKNYMNNEVDPKSRTVSVMS